MKEYPDPYNFAGMTIHDAMIAREQVRKKISKLANETKEERAAVAAVEEINDALGEHIYQEVLKQEKMGEGKNHD